jgi:RNA polymerase sigma factor (sigma-70 family)
MAKFYDKKAHWHACKREILDKRLKKIVNDDFSDFFDYSSDFWLSLCIAYFTLSYDVIWKTKNNSIKDILKYFYDPENFKYEKNEINNILGKSIDMLPEKEKMVVTLYYYEELTLKEISVIMTVSESRISQLHTKAIMRLKGKLGRQKSVLMDN